MSRLAYLLTLTPLESLRLLRRRLPVLRRGPDWTAVELLSSAKHSRGIRFAELLLRQEAIVRRQVSWTNLDFENRRVVEIGCGPLAGFGPLAIFRGAASFESAEPEWNAELFAGEAVADRYLRILHADLVALYGPHMTFPEFSQALDERMTIHRMSFDQAPFNAPADIVLSQSCLEHVFPLAATVEKIARIRTSETRFLHLVDFGNHYPTVHPFEGLYDQPPAEYIARRGQAINMLRKPDVAQLFAAQGIAAHVISARIVSGYPGPIHTWWRERYDDDALFTQLILIAGPKG